MGPSLIQTLFHTSTREDILHIQLSQSRSRNKLMWMETKSRTFSVKMAYEVALRLHRPGAGEHSLASHDKRLSNRVWAWCACFDVLPTWANLLRWKVHIDPLCTLCGQHDETIGHILWECSFALNTWALVRGKIQKSSSEAPYFYLLAHQMLDRLPKKEIEVWAITTWSLWTAWNKFHFEQVRTPPTLTSTSGVPILSL